MHMLWTPETVRQAAVIAGRCITYFATHQTNARYLCALAFEMEHLGLPQWAALRWSLDRALGQGHCRDMWMEEMGYADEQAEPGGH